MSIWLNDNLFPMLGCTFMAVYFAGYACSSGAEDAKAERHPDLRISAESEWQTEIAERDRQIRGCVRRGGVAAMGFGRTVVCVKPMEKE